MAMIDLAAGERSATAYLAKPASGAGPGVLVLHAWWGLNDSCKQVCERLAEAGFVALAPDLYEGKIATTIEQAEQLMKQRDFERRQAIAVAALDELRAQAEGQVATLGFSMGAAWASALASARPADVAATVIFYGTDDSDFAASRAAYLCHFGENDEFEPLEGVREMEAAMRAAGRDVTLHIYPGAQHWFVEPDRPEYDRQAAELAWQRTIAFLHSRLNSE